jgi:class 3 adenylate cyclase
MQQYMREMKAQNANFWELRIGIHTGPVIAGVIGQKKYSYDIWGDTVNVASRMESSGEAGKVNISGQTYELVRDFFICEYRGKMPVKYKGEIEMYFVKGSALNCHST